MDNSIATDTTEDGYLINHVVEKNRFHHETDDSFFSDSKGSSKGKDLKQVIITSSKDINQEQQQKPESKQQEASLSSTTFNLINSTIGGGIIGLPLVLDTLGLVFGIVCMAISGMLSVFLAELILRAKNISKKESIIEIGQACIGKKTGYFVVSIINIINNLGLAITYLAIFSIAGTQVSKAMFDECAAGDESAAIYCEQWAYTLVGGFLILPFSFAKSMDALKSSTLVKIIALTIFCLMTISYCVYCYFTDKLAKDIHIGPKFPTVITGLGTINIMTMSCAFHYNYLSMYKSVKGKKDSNMRKATNNGMLAVVVINLSVAVTGYLAFGKNGANLLRAFSPSIIGYPLFYLYNFAFMASALMTVPIVFFDARNCLLNMIEKSTTTKKSKIGADDEQNAIVNEQEASLLKNENESTLTKKSTSKRTGMQNFLILMIHAVCMTVAALVPQILSVFELIGSSTVNCFMFMFPCLFYIYLTKGKGRFTQLAILIFIFGIGMLVTGVWSSILGFMNGIKG